MTNSSCDSGVFFIANSRPNFVFTLIGSAIINITVTFAFMTRNIVATFYHSFQDTDRATLQSEAATTLQQGNLFAAADAFFRHLTCDMIESVVPCLS